MGLGNWMREHPRLLEVWYKGAVAAFMALAPITRRIGIDRLQKPMTFIEDLVKKPVWDCRTCGQCILHSTGMTCPMTCPKNIRNGPCGGVRANGKCEVYPDKDCIWVKAYERSLKMRWYGHEMLWVQPPVNHKLQDTSAWLNMLSGVDKQAPPSWEQCEAQEEPGPYVREH